MSIRTYVLLSLCCLCLWAVPGHAESKILEYRVKAAFLYNFARYTQWPKSVTLDQSSFDLCLHDAGQMHDPLEELVKSKKQGRANFRVRPVEQQDDLSGCRVLYAKTIPSGHTHPLRNAADEQGLLIVGEERSFAEDWGMVGFYIQEGRIRFAINPQRVQGAGLNMSSRLLGLADIVEGR